MCVYFGVGGPVKRFPIWVPLSELSVVAAKTQLVGGDMRYCGCARWILWVNVLTQISGHSLSMLCTPLLFFLCFGKAGSDLEEWCVVSSVWPRRGDPSRKVMG